jgi:hypothetical protein
MTANFVVNSIETRTIDSGFLILLDTTTSESDAWTPVAGLLAGVVIAALLLGATITTIRCKIAELRVARFRRTEVRARAQRIIRSASRVRTPPPCASMLAAASRPQRILVSGRGIEPGRQRAPDMTVRRGNWPTAA